MNRPYVVAVSGYSGSGKSTLVLELSKALPSCVTLFFDDYASRKDFPADIVSWIGSGGDPNEVKTPLLREHLLRLINGETVLMTKRNGWAEEYGVRSQDEEIELKPADIILLEEPFGKAREEVAGLIDMVIYLEVNPEISLGRRIHDLIKYLKHDPEVLINLLDHFLFDYLHGGVREMYLLNGIRVKGNADLIADANMPISSIVDLVKNEIIKTSGNS